MQLNAGRDKTAKDPKSELNEIYQKLRLPLPQYQCIQAPTEGACSNRFVCNLSLPAIGDNFPETIASGEGAKKVEAKNSAAKQALSMIHESQVIDAMKTSANPENEQTKRRMMELMLGSEGSQVDPEVSGPVFLAQQHLEGWIPISSFLPTKKVKAWFKQLPIDHASLDCHEQLRLLSQQLREAMVDAEATGGSNSRSLELSSNGLSVRCAWLVGEEIRPVRHVVEEDRVMAVVVPAEPGQQVQEIQLDTSKHYLAQISSLLSCTPDQLIPWDHAGLKTQYIMHPLDLPPQISQITQNPRQDSIFSDKEPAVSSGRAPSENDRLEANSRLATQRSAVLKQKSVGSTRGLIIGKKVIDLSTAATEEHKGPAAMDWAPDDDALTAEVAMPFRPTDVPPSSSLPLPSPSAPSLASTQEPSSLASHPHVLEIKPPTVYSVVSDLPTFQPDSRPLNLIASWLTGQPIYGPVVVSLVRCSRASQGHEVHWRSYPVLHLWRSVSGLFPVAEYTRSLTNSVLGRLPKTYSSGWSGKRPFALLEEYCKRNSWRCGKPLWEQTKSETEEEGGPIMNVSLEVNAFGTGHKMVDTAGASQVPEHAKQEAALKLLHRLQDVDAAALMNHAGSYSAATHGNGAGVGFGELMDLMEGESPAPNNKLKPGNVVKVHYQLFLTADDLPADTGLSYAPSEYVFEKKENFSFVLGSGAVAACLEQLVTQCPVGESADSRVSVCLEGADPLSVFRPSSCRLWVTVLDQSRPAPPGQPQGPGMFSPPLAKQRYELIAQVCRDKGAKFLLDLGCGDGALIEYLVKNASDQLERVCGMDVSATQVAAAIKRMEKLLKRSGAGAGREGEAEGKGGGDVAKLADGPEDLSPAPCEDNLSAVQTQIFRGSIADMGLVRNEAWGPLCSCDVAALVEVVEHLDPEVLLMVGPTVFGGLNPPTIIISTPNWEYNKILRTLGKQNNKKATQGSFPEGELRRVESQQDESELDPAWPRDRHGDPLRNVDHRFEWTRHEFETWCWKLADTFGYEVKFEGIGNALDEITVLSDPAWEGPKDVGRASQAAVFSKVGIVSCPIEAKWGPRGVRVGSGREGLSVDDEWESLQGSGEGENGGEEAGVEGNGGTARGNNNKRASMEPDSPSLKYAKVQVEVEYI